jgi:hypothetical protein
MWGYIRRVLHNRHGFIRLVDRFNRAFRHSDAPTAQHSHADEQQHHPAERHRLVDLGDCCCPASDVAGTSAHWWTWVRLPLRWHTGGAERLLGVRITGIRDGRIKRRLRIRAGRTCEINVDIPRRYVPVECRKFKRGSPVFRHAPQSIATPSAEIVIARTESNPREIKFRRSNNSIVPVFGQWPVQGDLATENPRRVIKRLLRARCERCTHDHYATRQKYRRRHHLR